ncbi:MAG: metallophosphoesterase [Treponemataceae bacterium]|nr:MAG: metallophosphoesterase [Treponemataceae bacterium]
MKFLCLSDTIDPLVYSEAIKERFADVDAVLCAGDLPMEYIDFVVSMLNVPVYFVFGNHNLKEFPYYHKSFQTEELFEEHNSKKKEPFSGCGAVYAGFKVHRLKVAEKKTLLIAGSSGSIWYNGGMAQYSDRRMFLILLGMAPSLLYNKIRYGRFLDVFLTHSPPYKIHDKEDPCHTGFKCFRWFLKQFQPACMIHGHIHLYDFLAKRVSVYHKTKIINVYSHYVADVDIPQSQFLHMEEMSPYESEKSKERETSEDTNG